ncbi:hypothetical protein THASP1DRAFT_24525 [Thamnocephalis sphaerospora]|uniref:G-protein coupled receptors family 2 profile 2 domain-containing protein n=1 Tax=Thamnocephalis sphaerospora TaxID=78915 RepID=A0A4P9XN16_9FUNG|nr:hypothetical protein THASP1DRAFT_24525 [Thamnocephalis sphaerospora]|eukprot:RKP07306.1 hypothetical protein THASP1DRAFT_24525 [Thamnocephalis sphaerospora]
MAILPEQWHMVGIISTVMASISSRFAISGELDTKRSTHLQTYAFLPRFRNGTAELVAYMAFAELVSMSAYAIGQLGFRHGSDSALCQWQGAAQQVGDLSTIFWTLCIAISLYLIMFRGWSIPQTTRLHKRHYMAFCTSVPLLVGLVPLALRDSSGRPFYGESNLWCWIASYYPAARIYLFYVPLWVVFVFNLTIYILVGVNVWRRAHQQQKTNVSLYLIAYILARTPATINRVYSLVNPDAEPVFTLNLLHSLFTPATGLINFVVYAYIGWIGNIIRPPSQRAPSTIPIGSTHHAFYTVRPSNASAIGGSTAYEATMMG